MAKELLKDRELKQTTEKNLQLREDLLILGVVLLNFAIIALDFYSHPHAGVADLERRQQLTQAIGFLANHIGNYGFSASLATIAVLTKHTLATFSEKPVWKNLTHRSHQWLLASIFALNIAIETISNVNNTQAVGDISAGFIGIILGAAATELSVYRLKKGRSRVKSFKPQV